MLCETCRIEIGRDQSFEVGDRHYCSNCFFKVADAFRENVTPEQRKRLRELIKEEMEGILPRAALKGIVADGFDRIAKKESAPDDELGHIVNQVERVCGLAMFREILSVIGAIKTALDEQEDQLRDKLRKLQKI